MILSLAILELARGDFRPVFRVRGDGEKLEERGIVAPDPFQLARAREFSALLFTLLDKIVVAVSAR